MARLGARWRAVLVAVLAVVLLAVPAMVGFAASKTVVDNSDEEQVKDVIRQYFTCWFETMMEGRERDFSAIMEDTVSTYFMKKLIAHDLLIDKQWEFYRMNLNYSNLNVSPNDTANATVILDYDYRTIGQEVTTSVCNIEYRFKLNKSGEKWKITEIMVWIPKSLLISKLI